MTQINNESDLYNIHNLCIDAKSRELYLHSSFDSEEESGVEFRSAIMFEKNVRYLNQISHDPILVHMHLPGGDWQDCMGIVDTITTSHSKIFILAYGKVESASSILFQAAHLRVLMPNTHMLIHYGSLSIEDEHRAAKSSFEWSEKESLKMINMFSERCIGSPIAKERNWKKHIIKKHIMSQLDNKSDWILNADESVYYGFADGVLGDRKFTTIDKLKSRKR
jgi:ATP-dependent protease ClpP protease subunit